MAALPMVQRGIATAGLAVDAYIHLKQALPLLPGASSTISEGTVFRIEAAAIITALLVVFWRHRSDDAFT
ncbi:hypothetical protein ACQFX6_40220 [Streptomyces sp. DSM 41987]|uniref:hypothetical protein n=1 Tax=Streptomyces TaxID=1883 RepID=UPI003617B20A